MTRLDLRYNWGSTLSEENPDLYRQLNDVYTSIAEKSNGKTNKHKQEKKSPPAPGSASPVNKTFDIGDIWVREDTNTAWIMTSRTTPEVAHWQQIT